MGQVVCVCVSVRTGGGANECAFPQRVLPVLTACSPVLTGLIPPDFPLKTCTFPIRSECQISRETSRVAPCGRNAAGRRTHLWCRAPRDPGPQVAAAGGTRGGAGAQAGAGHRELPGARRQQRGGGWEQGWVRVNIPVAALSLGWLSRLCACVGGSLCVWLFVRFLRVVSLRAGKPSRIPHYESGFTVFSQSPQIPTTPQNDGPSILNDIHCIVFFFVEIWIKFLLCSFVHYCSHRELFSRNLLVQ